MSNTQAEDALLQIMDERHEPGCDETTWVWDYCACLTTIVERGLGK